MLKPFSTVIRLTQAIYVEKNALLGYPLKFTYLIRCVIVNNTAIKLQLIYSILVCREILQITDVHFSADKNSESETHSYQMAQTLLTAFHFSNILSIAAYWIEIFFQS